MKTKLGNSRKTSPVTTPRIEMRLLPGDGEFGAHTVIYVHGVGNKPPEDVLCCMWDSALFEQRMGDRSRMAYWVNRRRYPSPSEGHCHDPDGAVAIEERRGFALLVNREESDPEALIEQLAKGSNEEREFLHQVLGSLEAGQDSPPKGPGAKGLLDPLTWLLTRAVLRDVHDFFFDKAALEAMRQAKLAVLDSGGGPFVVIGHSQGSMIAYDVLRELDPARYPVSLFVSLGSPLGLPPVRSRFKKWTGQKKLAVPACAARWLNVANLGDPVNLDNDLTNDIAKSPKFANIVVDSPNEELRRDKHAATGYLRLQEVRVAVREAVGSSFLQPVNRRVIAPDLVELVYQEIEMKKAPLMALMLSAAIFESKAQCFGVFGPSPFHADGDLGKFHNEYISKIPPFNSGEKQLTGFSEDPRGAPALLIATQKLIDSKCTFLFMHRTAGSILNAQRKLSPAGSNNPFKNIPGKYKQMSQRDSSKAAYVSVGWIPTNHPGLDVKKEGDTYVIKIHSGHNGWPEYVVAFPSDNFNSEAHKSMDWMASAEANQIMGKWFYVVPDNSMLKRRVRIELMDESGHVIASTPCSSSECYPSPATGQVNFQGVAGRTYSVCGGPSFACPQFMPSPDYKAVLK